MDGARDAKIGENGMHGSLIICRSVCMCIYLAIDNWITHAALGSRPDGRESENAGLSAGERKRSVARGSRRRGTTPEERPSFS